MEGRKDGRKEVWKEGRKALFFGDFRNEFSKVATWGMGVEGWKEGWKEVRKQGRTELS